MTPQPNIWKCEALTSNAVSDVARMMELSGRYVDHSEIKHQPRLLQGQASHLQVYLTATEGSSFTNTNETSEQLQSHLFRILLFNLDVLADGTLKGRVLCKRTENSIVIGDAGLWCTYTNSNDDSWEWKTSVPSGDSARYYDIPLTTPQSKNAGSGCGRLTEFGAFCYGPAEFAATRSIPIIEMYSFTIASCLEDEELGAIRNIRIVQRKSGTHCDKRLAWDWDFPRESWPMNMPWCGETGPFERFGVEIDGKDAGEVCGTEFPLREEDFQELEDGDEVLMIVRGMLFGGASVVQSETIAKPYFL